MDWLAIWETNSGDLLRCRINVDAAQSFPILISDQLQTLRLDDVKEIVMRAFDDDAGD